jgi:hypothetical protein
LCNHRIASYSIKLGSDDAVAGTELMSEIKEKMGDLWPDKGFIEYEVKSQTGMGCR